MEAVAAWGAGVVAGEALPLVGGEEVVRTAVDLHCCTSNGFGGAADVAGGSPWGGAEFVGVVGDFGAALVVAAVVEDDGDSGDCGY